LGSPATGLSAQEAAQRLATNGPNELKEGKRISPPQIFLGQFQSLTGVISGVLGEVVDAIAPYSMEGFYPIAKPPRSVQY